MVGNGAFRAATRAHRTPATSPACARPALAPTLHLVDGACAASTPASERTPSRRQAWPLITQHRATGRIPACSASAPARRRRYRRTSDRHGYHAGTTGNAHAPGRRRCSCWRGDQRHVRATSSPGRGRSAPGRLSAPPSVHARPRPMLHLHEVCRGNLAAGTCLGARRRATVADGQYRRKKGRSFQLLRPGTTC